MAFTSEDLAAFEASADYKQGCGRPEIQYALHLDRRDNVMVLAQGSQQAKWLAVALRIIINVAASSSPTFTAHEVGNSDVAAAALVRILARPGNAEICHALSHRGDMSSVLSSQRAATVREVLVSSFWLEYNKRLNGHKATKKGNNLNGQAKQSGHDSLPNGQHSASIGQGPGKQCKGDHAPNSMTSSIQRLDGKLASVPPSTSQTSTARVTRGQQAIAGGLPQQIIAKQIALRNTNAQATVVLGTKRKIDEMNKELDSGRKSRKKARARAKAEAKAAGVRIIFECIYDTAGKQRLQMLERVFEQTPTVGLIRSYCQSTKTQFDGGRVHPFILYTVDRGRTIKALMAEDALQHAIEESETNELMVFVFDKVSDISTGEAAALLRDLLAQDRASS